MGANAANAMNARSTLRRVAEQLLTLANEGQNLKIEFKTCMLFGASSRGLKEKTLMFEAQTLMLRGKLDCCKET